MAMAPSIGIPQQFGYRIRFKELAIIVWLRDGVLNLAKESRYPVFKKCP